MKKILLFICFSIHYYSYAQKSHSFEVKYDQKLHSITVHYSPEQTRNFEIGSPITLKYSNFPPKSSSWFWFVVMPDSKATSYDPFAGGGRLDYSDYIYGSGSWSTTLNKEGDFAILIAQNPFNVTFHGKIVVNIVKKKLSLDHIPETEKTAFIFPNPTSGSFTIKTEKAISEIEIHNQIGQCIVKTSSNQMDISNHPNGVYFATIRNTDNTTVKRKIIKK